MGFYFATGLMYGAGDNYYFGYAIIQLLTTSKFNPALKFSTGTQ
jgi:hypothetical protein